MSTTCVQRRSEAVEPLNTLPVAAARLAVELEETIARFVDSAGDENLGHLEVQVQQQAQELLRQATEKAAQQKADQTPPLCPVCQHQLTRLSHDQARTFETRFGPVTVRRTRGYCRRCRKWRFPADGVLGLAQTAGYSPGVQEMAALLTSKMPVGEASAVLERLTGVKMPRATMDREARRQGERAQEVRRRLDEQARHHPTTALQPELVLEPYQMVIQIDAWNIRERDQWGRTQSLRRAGQEPERWHWVYTGTCFRLDQRGHSAKGRPIIAERGFVATRTGIDGLREQLHAEALRRGLAQAVKAELNYLREHQDRMDYRRARLRGEPIGSGAVESTCRQTQCRFKRPGQYWTRKGDEALLCLETFWRNNRWDLLFPHVRL